MIRNGTIALTLMAVLGLTVAYFSLPLTPSGTIANEVNETTGDAFLCGSSTSVSDSFVDIDKVNIRQVKGVWEVTVSMGPSMETIFEDSFSAAVEVRLGIYTGLYQVHNGNLTINNAEITTEFLIFFFAVLLPLEVDLKVDSFHQAEVGDPVNCDTAFLEDATAGKTTPTASPTATEEQEATPPTPTGTAGPATTTPTPSTTPGTTTPSTTPGTTTPTPTASPSDTPTTTPPTATATPSDTPEPSTATPPPKEPPTTTPTPTAPPPKEPPTTTPTATPELFKVIIVKVDVDRGVSDTLPGWEMKVFAGNGCTSSPIASGLTSEGPDDIAPLFSVLLPRGEYSVAETQQPGWERIFPEGTFCQNFDVPQDPQGNLCCFFINRKIRNGDVNKDGVTNSIDVVLVLQFIAGVLPELPNRIRADVNEDGVVNAVDTALMLQFEAGLIDSLPQVPDDN